MTRAAGPSTAKVSDFSSSEYWSTRFEKERSFEWLANTRALGPVVLDLVKELSQARSLPPPTKSHPSATVTQSSTPSSSAKETPVNILHFGCGTSSLGPDLAQLLAAANLNAQVVDADYVAGSILTERPSAPVRPIGEISSGARRVPLINLDVLDRAQLAATAPEGGWDLLLDKSTADAISCGPSMPRWREEGMGEGEDGGGTRTGRGEFEGGDIEDPVEPIYNLCESLATVTRIGGRWLCISYSSTRFDHLNPTLPHSPSTSTSNSNSTRSESSSDLSVIPKWRLISATPLDGAFTGEPSTVSDGVGGKRVVYEPQTSVWAYILERI